MKKLTFLFGLVALCSFSSCSYYLMEEVQGGHSPMMMLDGQWQVDSYSATENGQAVQMTAPAPHSVWLNATQDVGGYCEGTWYEETSNVPDEFLWNIDPEATQFTIQDESRSETPWKVIEQRKNKFIIERTENNMTYRMELSK